MADANDISSKSYLRYQTGRFARSVKAINAVNTNKRVFISYQYQHDPYDVFRVPDGNMSTLRGRDVQHIIQVGFKKLAKDILRRSDLTFSFQG